MPLTDYERDAARAILAETFRHDMGTAIVRRVLMRALMGPVYPPPPIIHPHLAPFMNGGMTDHTYPPPFDISNLAEFPRF